MRAMPGIGDRIKEAREDRGATQQQIADLFGISRSAVQQWEDGDTSPRNPRLQKLARFLGVEPGWLITGTGVRSRDKNPEKTTLVVGYVGGGQAVHPIDDLGGGLEEVERPQGINGDIIAVRIRGNSMYPLKDGWLLFYRRDVYGVPDECRNKLCVCKVVDGPTYVKEVHWTGEKGIFLLESWNDVAIEGVKLEWAAPVLDIRPA